MTDHFRGYTLIHQQIVWCNASLSIVISPLAVCDSSQWDLETPTMLWNYPQIVIQLRPNHLKKLGDHALPWFPHHLANKTVPKRKIERGLDMGTNKSSICYTILCITRLNKYSKFEVYKEWATFLHYCQLLILHHRFRRLKIWLKKSSFHWQY